MATAKVSKVPEIRKNIDEGRRAARAAARLRFGSGPLPTNPATGKRFSGTGRSPTTGHLSPILQLIPDLPPVHLEGRFESRRQRAAALRQRMAVFAEIYNAAYLVRHSQHGSMQRREDCVQRFVITLIEQMRNCRDFEALIFAVADSLTADPLGVPWEG